jgi:uncharacterized DUF497 family protein
MPHDMMTTGRQRHAETRPSHQTTIRDTGTLQSTHQPLETDAGVTAESSSTARSPPLDVAVALRLHYTSSMPLREPKPSRWSEEHISEHGVKMDEVAEVLAAPHIESTGRDGTTIVTGQTDAGRYLLVVAVDDHGLAFIITARDMTESEKRAYRRRAKR